ncbi:MAG TPA: D-alanyl-D-alanine carboxypeptidase family protein [Rudaea sp.]|nr:D-alanyl-D-alanine carboxypeptidase family protein [Rudaea sp.]
MTFLRVVSFAALSTFCLALAPAPGHAATQHAHAKRKPAAAQQQETPQGQDAQSAPPAASASAAATPANPNLPTPNAPHPGALNVPTPPPPALSAKSWVLMDFATGQILADNAADERVEPASITKVMTAYVVSAELAAGKVKLDDQVFISENAWRAGGASTDGSTSFLAVNSKVPLKDLLYGMIIQSGNDAAIALAEHIAGSEQTFAELMNQYAAKLGMTGTHYVNASGLPDPNHYSTARDIALLSRAVIRDFPEEYKIYAVKEFEWNGITQHNRNTLLWRDASVDGIKTGHTKEAGFCLATSAKRGDQRLIAVVMGAASEKQRADDNQSLLNYGFRFYESHKLYDAGKALATPELWKGAQNTIALGVADDVLVTLPRGRYNDLKATMDMPNRLIAPYTKGQQVGTVKVALDGKVLVERPLVALADAPEAGFWGRLSDGILLWFKGDKKSDVSSVPNTK